MGRANRRPPGTAGAATAAEPRSPGARCLSAAWASAGASTLPRTSGTTASKDVTQRPATHICDRTPLSGHQQGAALSAPRGLARGSRDSPPAGHSRSHNGPAGPTFPEPTTASSAGPPLPLRAAGPPLALSGAANRHCPAIPAVTRRCPALHYRRSRTPRWARRRWRARRVAREAGPRLAAAPPPSRPRSKWPRPAIATAGRSHSNGAAPESYRFPSLKKNKQTGEKGSKNNPPPNTHTEKQNDPNRKKTNPSNKPKASSSVQEESRPCVSKAHVFGTISAVPLHKVHHLHPIHYKDLHSLNCQSGLHEQREGFDMTEGRKHTCREKIPVVEIPVLAHRALHMNFSYDYYPLGLESQWSGH
ncbi:serine/arginine repetitive matrix protein 1-like [Oenanthe melanoleuca]|uniref:serine/arginine repetitive matrix protein 1-like n=1 Tax=Oenanthe melanoleuca TaxID=2939378 RepID=UPI0024C1927C|nr:serine/arginine repetitive matrix protein 1-like [Oenanthe melanoleuca]